MPDAIIDAYGETSTNIDGTDLRFLAELKDDIIGEFSAHDYVCTEDEGLIRDASWAR